MQLDISVSPFETNHNNAEKERENVTMLNDPMPVDPQLVLRREDEEGYVCGLDRICHEIQP